MSSLSNIKNCAHLYFDQVTSYIKNVNLKPYLKNVNLKPWQRDAIVAMSLAGVTFGVGCYLAGGPTALFNVLISPFSTKTLTCCPLFNPNEKNPYTLENVQTSLQSHLAEIKQVGALQKSITTCVNNTDNVAIQPFDFRISDKSNRDSLKIKEALSSSAQNVYACFDITPKVNSRDYLHINIHFFKKIPEVCV